VELISSVQIINEDVSLTADPAYQSLLRDLSHHIQCLALKKSSNGVPRTYPRGVNCLTLQVILSHNEYD
jgi:hypothetical protein